MNPNLRVAGSSVITVSVSCYRMSRNVTLGLRSYTLTMVLTKVLGEIVSSQLLLLEAMLMLSLAAGMPPHSTISVVLLLQWIFMAFPVFIVCVCSIEGLSPGY